MPEYIGNGWNPVAKSNHAYLGHEPPSAIFLASTELGCLPIRQSGRTMWEQNWPTIQKRGGSVWRHCLRVSQEATTCKVPKALATLVGLSFATVFREIRFASTFLNVESQFDGTGP